MGAGLFFDGTNEAQTSACYLSGLTQVTLSVWAVFNTGAAQYGRIVEYGANDGFVLNQNDVAGSNKLSWNIQNTGTAVTTSTPCDNQLHHIVCRLFGVSSGSVLSIVVDAGAPVSATLGGDRTIGVKSLYFGRYGGGGYRGTFTLFDCRIYGRALTDAEVFDLYAKPWDLYAVKPARRAMSIFNPAWASGANRIIGAQPC